MTPQQQEFLGLANNRFKMGFFMLTKLPSAWFAGVRVKKVDPEFAEITVPFKWFSQNPFRSTYFACLSMAAEMSTGLLALMNLHKIDPQVSMLVLKVHGNYHKKATGITTFRCDDGLAIKQAVGKAIETGEGVMLETISRGYNENQELVADFSIVWTFKAKKQK
ncbi:MAG TPA: DUF4442 domain-containing protein [Chitinophagaceae bacterium]|nr:DUF4442 domain-containing protein [Chitinophagaceae bacterium]